MDDVSYVSAEGLNTWAIRTDGSLWSLGRNNDQRLFTKTQSNLTLTHIKDDVIAVPGTMAITSDGSLWAWGNKHRIGLVVDDPENRIQATPVNIMDDVATVSISSRRTMITKADGSLWELRESTAHADGTTNSLGVPVWIMNDVAYVSIGLQAKVLKTDGSLWGWSNVVGQREPVKIMDDVVSVSSGFNATMAIKTDGSLWAWGVNGTGQLGAGLHGRDIIVFAPAMIMEDVVAVSMGGLGSRSAGRAHTIAIKSDGSLWAWGNNRRGQLGTGTWISRSSPVKISTVADGWTF